jgi:hypothetical protein
MATGRKDVEISPVASDRIFTQAEPLPPPAVTYTVSARGKKPQLPVFAYLRVLKKFHKAGNSIICTNDDLARWVRDDFPLEPYIKLGFHRFKLLRARPCSITGF